MTLLHLSPNVVTLRSLLHLRPNVITLRSLLHLRTVITFRSSTTSSVTNNELEGNLPMASLTYVCFIPAKGLIRDLSANSSNIAFEVPLA